MSGVDVSWATVDTVDGTLLTETVVGEVLEPVSIISSFWADSDILLPSCILLEGSLGESGKRGSSVSAAGSETTPIPAPHLL